MRLRAALIVAATALSACATDGLQEVVNTGRGPDEFIVDPKAELQMPTDFSALPPPTPGQGNRADIDHEGNMVVALGGRPSNANAPVPSSDAALVTAASRNGVTPNIRQQLAQEDAEFRRGQSRFTGFQLFPENLYNKVYSRQALDARATADAWRRAGASTPSFPPPD